MRIWIGFWKGLARRPDGAEGGEKGNHHCLFVGGGGFGLKVEQENHKSGFSGGQTEFFSELGSGFSKEKEIRRKEEEMEAEELWGLRKTAKKPEERGNDQNKGGGFY